MRNDNLSPNPTLAIRQFLFYFVILKNVHIKKLQNQKIMQKHTLLIGN